MSLDFWRDAIRRAAHADEHSVMARVLAQNPLSEAAGERVLCSARDLVERCREDKDSKGTLDAFLQEFGLSNKEGVALMCLSEALLRIPDAGNANRLIAEKIRSGDWASHQGKSDSLFVNASTWGLMLTGNIVRLDPDITDHTGPWLAQLTARLSEPVVRAAVFQAIRIMGGQYVLGRTIDEGLARFDKDPTDGARYSFDMLGEAARTEDDAKRYFEAYLHAIEHIGQHTQATDVYRANGISVKLSALHPRYEFAQWERVMPELLARIKALCVAAKRHSIGLSIDAEEAARLEPSLDLFAALARDAELDDWQGLGFVLQAYLKRAPWVATWLIELARLTRRRLMVRLVKGAYWDSEIKHAQEQGLADYPVFTRKANTDACYQHCAYKLLLAGDEIYPQFATHNAYTATVVAELAAGRTYEFQRLHGMGHILYRQLQAARPDADIPLRIYAPIGNHKDLLPYLVRRLLENGANSSFVNRFLDEQTPVDELIQDVRAQVSAVFPHRHKRIPLPADIFRAAEEPRDNARGIDLDSPSDVAELNAVQARIAAFDHRSGPIVGGELIETATRPVRSPADGSRIVGQVSEADETTMETALQRATRAQPAWNALGGSQRAARLRDMANRLEARTQELMSLISLEAGRNVPDALAEVREAVDFCRYYALHAERIFEDSELADCGTFLCISPWNFPLAIFTGQIAAALAAGNAVIAKPAEQTPLVAAETVKLFHQAGVPADVLHSLPGDGATVGARLVEDPRIAGIAFTGSTGTAQSINRSIASRAEAIPLIAETGGLNCMIADSTALPEQLVDDVIASAFSSAGQRCSALRVLFIQKDIADDVLGMLKGAMEALVVGNPWDIATDVGPVVDAAAKRALQAHIDNMTATARLIAKTPAKGLAKDGHFVAPHAFEIESLDQLPGEVFGPILHVIPYASAQLDNVLRQIDATGYGLTLGVHSRIQAMADHVYRHTRVGNTYINRNMIGAAVGVNPFGGRGLSGTGPKAGGPNYLYRFARAGDASSPPRPWRVPDCPKAPANDSNALNTAAEGLAGWSASPVERRLEIVEKFSAGDETDSQLKAYCSLAGALARTHLTRTHLTGQPPLPGPTGEKNLLCLHARGVILCIAEAADSNAQIAVQVATALMCGCTVVVCTDAADADRIQSVVESLRRAGAPDNIVQAAPLDGLRDYLTDPRVAGVSGVFEDRNSRDVRSLLARNNGPLVPTIELPGTMELQDEMTVYAYLLNFVYEKTRTDNLVAVGGNTQLFNLGE